MSDQAILQKYGVTTKQPNDDSILQKYGVTSNNDDQILQKYGAIEKPKKDINLQSVVSDKVNDWLFGNQEQNPMANLSKTKGGKDLLNNLEQYWMNTVNTLGFGVPEYGAGKLGYKIPEPETGSEAIAAGLGQLTGFIKGPLKVGSAVSKGLPIVPASTKAGAIGQTLLKSGISLGVASASMTPKDSLIGAGERTKQFGQGFVAGTALGGARFVPNAPLRMALTSAYMGKPWSKEAREQPLEQQVFNYGLGAYYGIKGTNLNKLVERGLQAKEGTEGKLFSNLKKVNQNIISDVGKQTKGIKAKSLDLKARARSLVSNAKYHYEPVVNKTKWRKTKARNIYTKLKALKKDPNYVFRQTANEDISFIEKQLRGKGGKNLTLKSIQNLDNATLFNIDSFLSGSVPQAPKAPFRSQLPTKQGEAGPKLTSWMRLGSGRGRLRRLGLGKIDDPSSITREFVMKSAADQARFMQRHIEITNNWKRMVGVKKETSKRLFKYLDGKLHKNALKPKELEVANQMRNYYDSMLGLTNKYRQSKGMQPVKPRDNYVTHTFEPLMKEILARKHPFPEAIEANLRYINPKEKKSPFLFKRKGGQRIGLKEDVWAALDSYSYATSGVITDSPIRKADATLKFIDKQIRINEARPIGKKSKVDWIGIKKNLRGYLDGYANRRGEWEAEMENTAQIIEKHFPSKYNLKVKNVMDGLRGYMYFSNMAFRPKLAIRNLFQHSLIIGESGLGNLTRALKLKTTPETRRIQKKSDVLATRERGQFAPAIEGTAKGRTTQKVMKSGMAMFRGADWKNVKDAFWSGYMETTGGKIAKRGSALEAKAITRGDTVAAKTQYLYTAGNRSALAANAWGKSRPLGRMASVFTSWGINYADLMYDWTMSTGKPQYSTQLNRYFATNAVLLSTLGAMGVNVFKYTGVDSIPSLAKMVFTLKPPISGVSEGIAEIPKFIKDLKKLEKGLGEYLLYQWR